MSFDLTVHHAIRGEHGDGVGFRVTPYNMISDGMSRVYIRGGQFWDEQGNVMDMENVPEYATSALGRYNDAMREELGFEPRPVAPVRHVPPGKKATD